MGQQNSVVQKQWNNIKRPVDKYTMDGDFVETIPSLSEAAPSQDDSTMRHIWECCNGGRRSVNGYIYRYHGDMAPIIRPVSCVEIFLYKDGSLTETFYGYKELAQKYNINLGTLQQISRGQKPKALKQYRVVVIKKTIKYTKEIFNELKL